MKDPGPKGLAHLSNMLIRMTRLVSVFVRGEPYDTFVVIQGQSVLLYWLTLLKLTQPGILSAKETWEVKKIRRHWRCKYSAKVLGLFFWLLQPDNFIFCALFSGKSIVVVCHNIHACIYMYTYTLAAECKGFQWHMIHRTDFSHAGFFHTIPNQF